LFSFCRGIRARSIFGGGPLRAHAGHRGALPVEPLLTDAGPASGFGWLLADTCDANGRSNAVVADAMRSSLIWAPRGTGGGIRRRRPLFGLVAKTAWHRRDRHPRRASFIGEFGAAWSTRCVCQNMSLNRHSHVKKPLYIRFGLRD
jgi:hypothetical protein